MTLDSCGVYSRTTGPATRGEPLDGEGVDGNVGGPIDDEISDDGPDDGAELEAVRGKTKGVEQADLGRAWANHRNAVAHASFDTCPGPHNPGAAHKRKEFEDRLCIAREFAEIKLRAIGFQI